MFRENQEVWYKTRNKKAKITKIWNNKVDKGKNRMFELRVYCDGYSIPSTCFEYEIEEIDG